MNDPQQYIADDEISLLDIYDFIKEGWKTLVATTVLGGTLGVGAAFVIPEKFQASGSIQSTRVMGNDVESIAVLAEKMRSPSYYSAESFAACDLENTINPAQELVKSLNPNLARQSAFVSVSFKSKNIQTSTACLNAVLADVQRDQDKVAAQQLLIAQGTLEKEKEKLKLAEEFVSTLSGKSLSFDFKDTQFSASSLLIATLQSRQAEITELKNNIQRTQLLLTEPQTRGASFATPIYAPTQKVEPKRALIAIISVMAGGFLGLMLLILLRVLKNINERKSAPVQ